MEGSNQNHLPS